MGRLMDAFSACFGLGLAAGAGYYLYRKFTSGKSEEESTKNSASQSGAVKEVNSTANERDKIIDPPSETQSARKTPATRATVTKATKQRTSQMSRRPCRIASKTIVRNKTNLTFRQQTKKLTRRGNRVLEDSEKVSCSRTVQSQITEFVLTSATSLMDYTVACFMGGTKQRRFRMSFSFEFKFTCEEVEELSTESVKTRAAISRASIKHLSGCAMQEDIPLAPVFSPDSR